MAHVPVGYYTVLETYSKVQIIISVVEGQILIFIETHSVVHSRRTICKILMFCSFVFFLLVIVLSVLLRFTPSNYPSGLIKLFLCDYSTIQQLPDKCRIPEKDVSSRKSCPKKDVSSRKMCSQERRVSKSTLIYY